MTPRERIDTALRHRAPDRTPMFEYVLLPPLADRLLGRPSVDGRDWREFIERDGWEQTVRQLARDRLDLAEMLGHDMLYVVPNPPRPQDGSLAKPAAPELQPDDPVERMRLRNERAARSIAPPHDDSLLIYRILRSEMDRRGIDLPILAPAYAHGVWTDVDLMQAMLLAPDAAHEHFALATRRTMLLVERYIELGIDQIGVGGDFAGNRPLISPDAYREFIVPEVRTLSHRIHAAGRVAVNASDGNLWSVIDDFLVGCDADGYLEIDLHAGMYLRRLKAAYGGRIAFYGNMDCGNTLSFASPEQVRRATIDCLQAGLGDGGHVFCASNAITASVPLENYLAMINAYREFFGLQRIEGSI